MMSYDEQVRMFKDSVMIGPKSVSELVEYLNVIVDVAELTSVDLPAHILQIAESNATKCILNDALQLDSSEMSISAYKVILSDKSKQYLGSEILDDDFIYVVFEEHTGYILSNSNRLFLDLEYARGVSQQEFDSEGDQFQSIIAHMAIDYCEQHGIEY